MKRRDATGLAGGGGLATLLSKRTATAQARVAQEARRGRTRVDERQGS